MRKQAAEDAAAAAAAARAAEAAGKRQLEQAAGRDITGVAGRKVQGRFGLEWEYMVQVDGIAVPLLDGESIDHLERDGDLVIDIIHHIWVQKKYAERTDNAWVQVRLGTGSHESDVSHTRSGLAPTTVPESKADCERDAQCVAGALALLHKPVVLPPDVDFLSVPTLLRHEAFKFDKPSKWGMPGLKGFENKPDGIELFCANAKPDEEYILRCYYEPTNTSLHCFAVKDCKVADPFRIRH